MKSNHPIRFFRRQYTSRNLCSILFSRKNHSRKSQ